jgi:hypothetical protein
VAGALEPSASELSLGLKKISYNHKTTMVSTNPTRGCFQFMMGPMRSLNTLRLEPYLIDFLHLYQEQEPRQKETSLFSGLLGEGEMDERDFLGGDQKNLHTGEAVSVFFLIHGSKEFVRAGRSVSLGHPLRIRSLLGCEPARA